MARQLLDGKELIKHLNGKLRPDTLGRLTREGKIPFIKFPGIRRYFYDQEVIDNWINSLSTNPTMDRDIPEKVNVLPYKQMRKQA